MTNRELARNDANAALGTMRRTFAIQQIRVAEAKGDSINYWLAWLLDREPTLEECIDMAADVDAASDRDYWLPTIRAILDDWHNEPMTRDILEELLGEGLGALQSERSDTSSTSNDMSGIQGEGLAGNAGDRAPLEQNGHVRGQNGHVRVKNLSVVNENNRDKTPLGGFVGTEEEKRVKGSGPY